jgi:hypothetical protein
MTLTLEHLEERQTELASLIEQFKAQKQQTILLRVPEAEIVLQPGEHYAGAVLDNDGKIKHHLVLMAADPDEDLTWDGATAWAKEVGGHLPDRQEQSLLFANCKPHLKAEWHWSSEVHESNPSYAWCCDFYDGDQSCDHKGAEGAAVAVRRVIAHGIGNEVGA